MSARDKERFRVAAENCVVIYDETDVPRFQALFDAHDARAGELYAKTAAAYRELAEHFRKRLEKGEP